MMLSSDQLGRHRAKALATMDAMPPMLRECVYEYGLPIVVCMLKHGIKNPAHIHEIVHEIWAGPRQVSQRRAPSSTLDWYFAQAGSDLNTDALLRILANNSLIIVPKFATSEMIHASMDTVAGHSVVCTKLQKHKMRLDAALRVGADYLKRLRRPYKGVAAA